MSSRPQAMAIALVLTSLFAATARQPAIAEPDALLDCVWRLDKAVDALGEPVASEVMSERKQIGSAFDRLRTRALENARHRDDLDNEKKKFDRSNREREDKMRQLDFEQKVLDQELADLVARGRLHYADAMAQHAAYAAADPEDEGAVANVNAWSARVDANAERLLQEERVLRERQSDINARRSGLLTEVAQHAQKIAALFKFRHVADQDFTQLMRECSSLTTRAMAVRQILNAPARAIEYEPPDAMAEKLVKDLGENLVEGAGGNYLKYSQVGRRVLANPAALRWISNNFGVSVKAIPAVAVVSGADLFADAALAGANQRQREVVKNLYLIGDYAQVMKEMVRRKGGAATSTVEYRAMVSELQRLNADMPQGNWDFFFESLATTAAVSDALISMASKYVAEKAGLGAAKRSNHLNNVQRRNLGKGGVVAFREYNRTVDSAVVETLMKASAQQALEAYSTAAQAAVPQPVPQLRDEPRTFEIDPQPLP